MDGFDNPYKVAQEIGFLGANHETGFPVKEAVEMLKYDFREIVHLEVEEGVVPVYECVGGEPRFIAEMSEGENPARYTSFVFSKEPDEDAFKSALIIELDRLGGLDGIEIDVNRP